MTEQQHDAPETRYLPTDNIVADVLVLATYSEHMGALRRLVLDELDGAAERVRAAMRHHEQGSVKAQDILARFKHEDWRYRGQSFQELQLADDNMVISVMRSQDRTTREEIDATVAPLKLLLDRLTALTSPEAAR